MFTFYLATKKPNATKNNAGPKYLYKIDFLFKPIQLFILFCPSQLTQMRAQLGDERFYTLVATLEEGVLKNLADHNIVLKPTV